MKNVWKKYKFDIKESERKSGFLELNVLSDNKNNHHEGEEIYSKYPKGNRKIKNLEQNKYDFIQRDLCRLYESNLYEDKIVISSKIVELLNDNDNLNQRKGIMLLILN